MINAQDLVKIKTAIVLNEMLADLQVKGTKYARINDKKIEVHNSFGKISVETGFTKTSIAKIFYAKTATKLSTLLPVLAALDKTLNDFSKRFEKLTDADVQKFKEQSKLKKAAPAPKKKSVSKSVTAKAVKKSK